MAYRVTKDLPVLVNFFSPDIKPRKILTLPPNAPERDMNCLMREAFQSEDTYLFKK